MSLKDAKVGSKIVVYSSWCSKDEIHTVERLTKKQAICKGASFMLETGKMVGSNGKWDTKYGRLPSDEQLAAVRLKMRIDVALSKIRTLPITAENLEAAEALIAASQPKTNVSTNNQKGE